MYAIMGITGQFGGIVGHALLTANQQVRAVVRDAVLKALTEWGAKAP